MSKTNSESTDSNLPAVLARERSAGPVPQYAQIPPSYYPEPELDDEGVPLSHYLWVLRRNRYKIIAFVAVCLFGTYVISSRLARVYEATTTVDVDRQEPTGIVGQDSQRLNAMNDADQFLATQIKLIQSDAVLRPVAQKFNLLEREKQFGDERVSKQATANAPIVLKKLKVTRPPNTYLLLISYRSPDPSLAADVANAIAHSYLEHTYNIRIRSSASLATFMEKQLEELRAKMELSGSALSKFEREMNVINPEEKTNILSARLLQLNTEYTTAQGDRVRKEAAYESARSGTLESAMNSSQGEALKRLLERLNEAQEKFTQVKEQFGIRHPEFRKADAEVKELKRQVETARQNILKQVELEYQEAARREGMLKRSVAESKAEYDQINARSFEYQQLRREADGDKQLYEELIRKIRESGINAGFQNNSIRLADSARPPVKPVFPRTVLNLGLAFLFSTLLAISGAIGSDLLDKSIRDPEQITSMLKTEVLGSLPLVGDKDFKQGAAEANAKACVSNGNGKGNEHGNGHVSIHGAGDGSDLVNGATTKKRTGKNNSSFTLFEESIRTLHSSVLLSDLDRGIHSLLVTSTAPGEGKTTTAAYLAISNAEQGHQTLLIDADLRRPSLHRIIGTTTRSGLSNVMLGETTWRETIVRPEAYPNLHFLASGPPSRRAPDLIARGLESLVEEAGREYRLIVIDSPPFLNFAEPLLMSTLVDGVLVVTVAGETNRHAVASTLATLKRVRANILGLVLNKVTKDLMENYHYYGYYGSYGKHYKKYYTQEDAIEPDVLK
jgi:capsular exopolysaccharide synthesis family protein